MIFNRQHIAREVGRCVGGRLLLLGLEAPADILDLGRGIECLAVRFLQLALELRDAVVLRDLGRFLGGFAADFLRFFVQFLVLDHAINLVRALAVKSTIGMTRA